MVSLNAVGYHNGGLCSKDRTLVEGLFLKGDIQVLCTTNTLAHGINLPAHTVIIKSTQYFNKEKGMYMEYDRSMVLQMCGRAGRPPFDDTGMVIIMTRRETVHLYENLLNGCEMVESQLLPCITEHLTAEIVQLTVTDVTHAIEWMKCSYLYVRMKKSPATYAVKKATGSDSVERHMQEICVQKINELSKYQMIWNDEDGFLLKPLEPGRLMTKYYLKFDTMKFIMQTPFNCTLEDVLHVVCRAAEISWIQLRRNEKKLLNDINIDKPARLRYHIVAEKGKRKKRIQTREEKIFVLANDCLTGDPMVHELSLIQDMNSICSNGCRIAKCMKEFFIYKKNYKGVTNSSFLAKSLFQKLWDDSPYLLKQLPGIGMVTAKALHSMGVKTFEALAEADPRRIETVTGRKYPFGYHIKESLQSLPAKVEMKFEKVEDSKKQGKSKLTVTLTRLSEQRQSAKRHFADLVIGVEEDNLIVAHEKIRVEEFMSPYTITIFVSNPPQGKLVARADLIFEEYIGMDIHHKIEIGREQEPSFIRSPRGGKNVNYAPKEEHILDDVSDTYRVGAKQVECSDSKEDNSMPSFNLIDDLDEIEAAPVVERAPVIEAEEDECRILSKKEVFNHIREKAKNFPILNTEKTTCSPSVETWNIKRKRILEKTSDMRGDIEVPRDPKRNKVTQQVLHTVSPETSDMAQSTVATGHISVSEIEKSLKGETVFDHIRNKAKSFQWFDQSSSRNYERPILEKYSFWTEPDSCDASASGQKDSFAPSADMTFKSDSEPQPIESYAFQNKECTKDIFDKNTCSKSSTVSSSRLIEQPKTPKTINSHKVHTCPLSSFLSDINNEKTYAGCFSQITSPRETMPGHSSEPASDLKEVNSFLGFKSVFSFL
uniref:DNA 3'-5' helicase n=1 Tax=Kalanchoe fedtschenkoi TaxID=63787 RepID=A0A7N0TMY8_KALFE